MAAKILVTGASGSVGRVLVRELIKKGKDVRAGIHTSDKSVYIKMSGVETVSLEFGDYATIDKALQDIKSLFLITPIAREEVEFARRMIDRARVWGVEHIVKLSMLNAASIPGTQFTRWHKQAENYIEESGIPYTFIRPNVFMQNFLRYVQPSGNLVAMPLNNTKVSYIDVRDVAAVGAEVLIGGKDFFAKTLELTGPDAITMDDVADVLSKEVRSHVGYIPISEDVARHILESAGTPYWLLEGMLELYKMEREMMNCNVYSTVEDVTGKKPLGFDRFARDHVEAFKAIVQHEHIRT
jgi:uncharacterized protein YbjT (DUF2867 family)